MQRLSEVITCYSAAKVGLIYFDDASSLNVVYTNAIHLDHVLCRTLGVLLQRVDTRDAAEYSVMHSIDAA